MSATGGSTLCSHACPTCGTRCGSTTTTSRSSSCPSISLDRAVSASGSMSQAYEERFLFLLVLLRQPRLRMVYVTSMPIAPEIVEYYLALLSGVIPSHARARLSLISVNDASGRSLSEKLLARPDLLRRIADLVPNPARSHMVPYNTTELERDVALSIGIPMYGADPRLAELGSKTGCRRLFAEVGVPAPLGGREPAQSRRDRRRRGGDAAANAPPWPAPSSSSTKVSLGPETPS